MRGVASPPYMQQYPQPLASGCGHCQYRPTWYAELLLLVFVLLLPLQSALRRFKQGLSMAIMQMLTLLARLVAAQLLSPGSNRSALTLASGGEAHDTLPCSMQERSQCHIGWAS